MDPEQAGDSTIAPGQQQGTERARTSVGKEFLIGLRGRIRSTWTEAVAANIGVASRQGIRCPSKLAPSLGIDVGDSLITLRNLVLYQAFVAERQVDFRRNRQGDQG